MNIVILGSGNVGRYLSERLYTSGHCIKQIYSRNSTTGRKLARKVSASFTSNSKSLNSEAEVYILAVNDDSIAEVARMIPNRQSIVLHTSGASGLSILKPYSANVGVLYPLQSFALNDDQLEETLFCIEANNRITLAKIKLIVESLHCKWVVLTSEKRAKLHVAAVFVNNFTNHLYALAYQYLHGDKISFALLKPLIQHTTNRIKGNPAMYQTGPAMRNDFRTIKKHQSLLKNYPELLKVYNQLTHSIKNFHQNEFTGKL